MSKATISESMNLNFFNSLSQSQNNLFWIETDTKELDNQEMLIEHQFTRQSKKSQIAKPIFLVLGVTYLYKISKKQTLKRLQLDTTHLQVIESLEEDNFLQLNSESPLRGFKLTFKDQELRILTSNEPAFQQWKQMLKRACLLSNFHEAYHVLKIIGKGSFAKVYLGQSNENQQQYAIKAFSKQYMIEQYKGQLSLLNEMKVMRNLKHQHIVQLHEVHETQNSIYFVLDLVQGGEFLQRVKERGLLKYDELIRIAYNLISAIQHIDIKKCYHRDLKPENLLLRSKDNNYDLIIADFGLAAFYEQDLIFKRCGTPGFVAPEILLYTEGNKLYDSKCDIFSAGVIMYLLVTGKQPFKAADQKAILKANKACQIDFGLPLFLKAPIEFQDLIQKMLLYNPADRLSATDCLKHKVFYQLTKELQSEQDQEDSQNLMRSNIAQYDVEYTCNLKNKSQNSSQDQVGSLQLHQRMPAYNGNMQTIDSLTNCSNQSFSKIDQTQIKQVVGISKFSMYSARLSKQNSVDYDANPIDFIKNDCSSPGRFKQGRQTDLHKIALKNSYQNKQNQNNGEEQSVNQENSEINKQIKRFNSSDMIKFKSARMESDQQSPIILAASKCKEDVIN